MTKATVREETYAGTPPGGAVRPAPQGQPQQTGLTSSQVWKAITKASFAIVGYTTPSGQPRSSGVVYKSIGARMYIAVAPDSWKAKHIALSHQVSVVVPVRRGGILSLILPIPPATIGFHGTAVVHPAGSADVHQLLEALGDLLPPERRESAAIVEVVPTAMFVTYGIGVPLMKMRDPTAARARVPVAIG